MAGSYNAHQDSSTTTQSSKQPRRAAATESPTNHQQQPKHHTLSREDDALPPPHEEKQQHHQKQRIAHPPPIVKAKALVADSSTYSSAFVGAGGVINDDDETEDEDEEVMRGRETKPVEAPKPKPKSVPPPPQPKVTKVKLTLSTATPSPSKTGNIANRTRLTSHPHASTSKIASPTYLRKSSSPVILLTDSSSSDDDSDDRPRKRQKGIPKTTYPKRTIGVASSETAKGKKKIKPLSKKDKDKAADATFSAGPSTRKSTPVLSRANPRIVTSSVSPKKSNSRSLPTPSRSSLRQVLAASVRDVTESRGTSPALSVQEGKQLYSDDSDLSSPDVDSEGDEDDAIQRSEEQALREEFEKGNTSRSGVGEDSSDEDDLSDLSEDDNDEGWEVRERERAEDRLRTTADSLHVLHNYNYHREASYADASFEEEEIDLDAMANNDIPETGGRGVVTWSDYDSVESEIEEGEFEVELEELLALSEAVVGPVREDEYELGEMWFEEMSNQGDDESGSAEDSEAEDDADSTMIAKQGWGKSSCGSASGGSTDSDDTDGYENYDEENGDTTDSLDSDDHVGLIRFGIEVDSDSTLDGFSSENGGGEIIYRHAPGTASLADVQPPTSADLASLPQYLFSGFTREGAAVGMMLNLQELADDPENAINHTVDELGVGRDTAVGILAGVNRSLAKGKGRAREIIEEETEGEGPGGPPAMGSFIPKEKGKGTELSMVIDGSDTIAPSPFSKVKKGKKRPRDFLDAATPSRRARADSKVSTASGRSVTDGSLSGEIPDMLSPLLPCETMDLGLEDLLNSSDSSDEDVETMTLTLDTTSSGLSDLSRWGRVPIGAFRTSTMPTFSPTQQYFTASAEESVAGYSGRRTSSGTLFAPVVGSVIRGSRTGSSSLSHTLSPYSATDVAARMITSPLLRPVRDTTEPSPPKLRNSTPKERRIRSKSSAAAAGSSKSSPAIATKRRTSIGTSPIIPHAPHPSTTPANFLSFPRLDLPRVSPLSLE